MKITITGIIQVFNTAENIAGLNLSFAVLKLNQIIHQSVFLLFHKITDAG